MLLILQIVFLTIFSYLIAEEIYYYYLRCRLLKFKPFSTLEDSIRKLSFFNYFFNYEKTKEKIKKAGNPLNMTPGYFFLGKFLIPIILGILALIYKLPLANTALILVLGFFLPDIYLISKTMDRKKEFRDQFPIVIETIELGSTADIPEDEVFLLAAENTTAKEMKKELLRLSANFYITKDREKVLEEFTQRVDIPEAKVLQMAICQGEKTGKVKEILSNLSDTMFNSTIAKLNAKEKSIEYKVVVAIAVLICSVANIILQANFTALKTGFNFLF